MAGIYIHIPFCKQACHYCDFHFSTNQEKKSDLVLMLAKELNLQKHYLGDEKINSIYFGGGTPSLLSIQELELIVNAIYKDFNVSSDLEMTLEANPDDLSLPFLNSLSALSFNRLSIGIQSFDDSVLRFLNRAHNADSAVSSVEFARTAGFKNISVDLIYAIPDQPITTWKKNIEQALQLGPEHISAYSLTIEEKTAFGKWAQKGKLKVVEDDQAAAQLNYLVTTLENHGLEQYEVSNFARDGFYSRHNSSYWKQQKYLGVGPSAHSYNGTSRQFNINNNHLYLKALHEGALPFTLEVLTREDQINDYLLTTLRTSWGTDLSLVKNQFGYDVITTHASYIEILLNEKLAVLEKDILRLTKQGMLLADKISADLFVFA